MFFNIIDDLLERARRPVREPNDAVPDEPVLLHENIVVPAPATLDAVVLRSELPGQKQAMEEREVFRTAEAFKQLVEAEWGLSYDAFEAQQAICRRVHSPKGICYDHRLRMTFIEQYSASVIPDAVLLRWGEARQRPDLFQAFCVAELERVQKDPWLLAQLRNERMPGRSTRYVCLGYWD